MTASYKITGPDGRIITAAFANSDAELMGVLKCFLALTASDPGLWEFTCRPAVLGPAAANSPALAAKNADVCHDGGKRPPRYEDYDSDCVEREFER